MKRNKSLWLKTSLAFASVGIVGASSVGFMKLYSHLNHGLGVEKLELESNISSKIENKNVKEAFFIDQFNEKIAEYVFENKTNANNFGPYVLLNKPLLNKPAGTKLSYFDFFDLFLEANHNETPRLKIEIGPIVFINNYAEAISPNEFIEYVNWYMANVSWGPDLLTLKEFKLSRGIKQNGNAITLGSHGGNKENTQIEFYPDAFFGSLPVYNVLQGPGNSFDSLTRLVNKQEIEYDELNDYVKKIPFMNLLFNDIHHGGVKLLDAVVDAQNTYVFNAFELVDLEQKPKTFFRYNELDKQSVIENMGNFNFVYYAKDFREAIKKSQDYLLELALKRNFKLKKSLDESLNQVENLIKKIKIKEIVKNNLEIANASNPKRKTNIPNIHFITTASALNDENQVDYEFDYHMISDEFYRGSPAANAKVVMENYGSLKGNAIREIIANNFDFYFAKQKHFRNFYALDKFIKNKEIYVYDIDNSKINSHFYKNKNEIYEFEFNNYDNTKVSKITINDFEVVDKNTLKLKAIDQDQQKVEYTLKWIDNKNKGRHYDDSFDTSFISLKTSVEYYEPFTPRLIKESSKFKDNKITKTFNIYTDVYAGLLDKILNKKPYLMHKTKGVHLVNSVDENGVLSYGLEDGEHETLFATDRIPYLALVSESDPSFQTTGINYLKYVGAHEYGHHQTLQYINDTSEQDVSVAASAINPRSGVLQNNYLNIKLLQEYLNARTSGLKVRKINAKYEPQETGTFINFSYSNQDDNRFETIKDVYGKNEDEPTEDFYLKKDRRFLQYFDQLETAAKLRGLKVSDLILMNAIDHESATISPSFNKNMKDHSRLEPSLFVDNNHSVNFTQPFKQQGISAYAGIIKDGVGNDILIDEQGNAIVYELINKDLDNPYVIDNINVLIKTNKNQPVLDLSRFLVDNSATEIDKNLLDRAVREIRNAINEVFTRTYTNSGWDEEGVKFSDSIIENRNYGRGETTELQAWRLAIYDILFRYKDVSVVKDFNKTNANNYEKTLLNNLNYPSVYFKGLDENESALKKASVILDDIENSNDDTLKAVYDLYTKTLRFADDGTALMPNQTKVATLTPFNKAIKLTNNYKYYGLPNISRLGRIFVKDIQSIQEIISLNQQEINQEYTPISTLTNRDGITRIYLYKDLSVADANNLDNTNFYPLITFSDNESNYYNALKNDSDLFTKTTAIIDGKQRNVIKFKSLEDLIDFISFDPLQYTITKINNNEFYSFENSKRVWNLEYIKHYFDLNNVYEYLKNNQSINDELSYETFLDKQSYTNFFNQFKNDFSWLLKTKDFSLEELDQYQHLFDGRWGLVGFATFGNEFTANSRDAKINEKFLELNQDNYMINDNPNIKKRTAQAIINSIKKEFNNLNIKNLEIDLAKVMQFSFGRTMFVSTYNQATPALIGNFFHSNQLSNIPNALGEVVPKELVEESKKRSIENYDQIFNNYAFNIAEVLTRDYVQTNYIPSTQTLNNLPNFLTNLSESNTGNEYIFSGNNTKQWLRRIIPLFFSNANLLRNAISLHTIYALRDYQKVHETLSDNLHRMYDQGKSYYAEMFDETKVINDELQEEARIDELKTKLSKISSSDPELSKKGISKIDNKLEDIEGFEEPYLINSLSVSFISKTRNLNNGYFKDRWLRKAIDWEIYDDQRNPVIDEKLSILDLDNKTKITDRARALWVYSLKSQGIGEKTISGIYRNKENDSTLMWGFIKKELANKVKKIAIHNEQNNKISYININTNNTSNLFYLKKQADINSKWTLEDEGYVAWVSEYAILSSFSNSVIDFDKTTASGSVFRIYFVDENHNEIKDLFSIGNNKYLAENGKSYKVAPNYIFKKENEDKLYIRISNQFSV